MVSSLKCGSAQTDIQGNAYFSKVCLRASRGIL